MLFVGLLFNELKKWQVNYGKCRTGEEFLGWSQVPTCWSLQIYRVKENKNISLYIVWSIRQQDLCSSWKYQLSSKLFVISLPLPLNIWLYDLHMCCAPPPARADWVAVLRCAPGKCWLWRVTRVTEDWDRSLSLETGTGHRCRGDITLHWYGQQNLPIIARKTVMWPGVMTRWIVVGKWQPLLLRDGDRSRGAGGGADNGHN